MVHILLAGQAFCGKPGVPAEWESGEAWISVVDMSRNPNDATCSDCVFEYNKYKASQTK